MDELKGKVVLLDFWTYGCINCMHNFPYLKLLQEEFPNELAIIGVHSAKFLQEGQTENIRNIVLRYDLTHPIVNDSEFQVFTMWGANAWPTLVLVDPAGNVVGGLSGEGFYDVMKPIIESLIREFDAKGAIDRSPLNFSLEKQTAPRTLLSFPGKLLVRDGSDTLAVTDTNHNRILIASRATGEIRQTVGSGQAGFVDGSFDEASFRQPQGLALSDDERFLYVADTGNHAIRRIDLRGRTVDTIAGTGRQAVVYPPVGGAGRESALSSPWDLELDGNTLYIAMAGSHQLWRMDLNRGWVEALAGNGAEGYHDNPNGAARLAQPSGLALDPEKGILYFADSEASSIRSAGTDPKSGEVKTLAGHGESLFEFGTEDGTGSEARFQHPLGVVLYRGRLYVADTYNNRIRVLDPESRAVTTLTGTERGWRDGTDPLFYEPGGIDAADGKLYVADTNNHSVRVIDLASGRTDTLVLKGRELALSTGGFFGGPTKIQAEPVRFAPGQDTLVMEITLPEGYKVNADAFSSFEWSVEGQGVVLADDANRSVQGPSFPLRIPVRAASGQGTINLRLSLVYCEEEKESVCLLDRAEIRIPYRVEAGRGGEARFRYVVRLPS